MGHNPTPHADHPSTPPTLEAGRASTPRAVWTVDCGSRRGQWKPVPPVNLSGVESHVRCSAISSASVPLAAVIIGTASSPRPNRGARAHPLGVVPPRDDAVARRRDNWGWWRFSRAVARERARARRCPAVRRGAVGGQGVDVSTATVPARTPVTTAAPTTVPTRQCSTATLGNALNSPRGSTVRSRGWGTVRAGGNGGAKYIPEGSPNLEFHPNGSGYIAVPW